MTGPQSDESSTQATTIEPFSVSLLYCGKRCIFYVNAEMLWTVFGMKLLHQRKVVVNYLRSERWIRRAFSFVGQDLLSVHSQIDVTEWTRFDVTAPSEL